MELNAGSMFVLAIIAATLALSLWDSLRSIDTSTMSPTAACEAKGFEVGTSDMEHCLAFGF